MGKRGFYFHDENLDIRYNLIEDKKKELIRANRMNRNSNSNCKIMPAVQTLPKEHYWFLTSNNVQQQFEFDIEKNIFIRKPYMETIDNNNNVKRLTEQSPDGLMYPYVQMFCRRCYKYGCENHEKYKIISSSGRWLRSYKNFLIEQTEETLSEIVKSKPDTIGEKFHEKHNTVSSNKKTKVKNKICGKSASESEEQIDYKYYPCNHPKKECVVENTECWCSQLGYHCEKFCGCSSNCQNRFKGCKCKGDCITKCECKCKSMNRECDPDCCLRCHSDSDDQTNIKCKNNALQRKLGARVLKGISNISGWGAFCGEAVKEGNLIAEYTGEIISVQESEARGDFYKENESSYLFELNECENIDAYFYGNNIRFANHSKSCNSYAQIMKVNGEHRVGIYAARNIEPEEEIVFDYGESFLFMHPQLEELID